MRGLSGLMILAVGLTAGAAGGYFYARLPPAAPAMATPPVAVSAAERKILYYRDPGGAPYWSAEPKKDAGGRDYLPVYEDEEVSFEPDGRKPAPPPAAGGARRILYYRNPMGLPDTSPVPKKDWMGMDYLPVHEGEEPGADTTVTISPAKVQRLGVRTALVHGAARWRSK